LFLKESSGKVNQSVRIYLFAFLMLPIKQIKFAEAEYSNKRQQMHKELFLKMKRVVLWKDLIAPHYSHEKDVRPALIHCRSCCRCI